jgi:hypothetical protein
LRYNPITNRNFALNSDFTIWQRGTSITPTSNGGAYTADRWFGTRGSNTSLTVSQQTAGNLSVTPNQAFRYYARVQRTASSTTTSSVDFGQMFETSQVTLLAGQTVTLSGYVRKGANFSATSDALIMEVIEGTGTDQKQMDGGYTGSNVAVTGTKTLTSSWQRFSITGTIATTSTEITIKFRYTPTGTAGAADYFDIAGVQLELGSVPTAWNLATGTLQGELAACQRYYWRSGNTSVFAAHGNGYASTTAVADFVIINPVPMRVGATSVEFSTLAVFDGVNAIAAITTVTLQQTSNRTTTISTGGSSGLTIYRPYTLLNNNNAAGYLAASAEL